ncbi:alpha/beta hydrolase [Streptomyces sp. NPDC058000]|uniref:alpha/beta hydrolase n=1 Tax=Streptomyces sp. NPDC058000 TaxID=3346299 RepID=UPI0036ED30F3
MRAARWRRIGLTVALAAAIVGSVTAGTSSPVPGTPAPPRLPPVQARTLDERYAANRDYLAAAEHAAHRLGDSYREGHLHQLRASGRQLLSFDARGDGQAVEVLGDLATADRIVVLVPGSDTTLDTFDYLGSRHASLAGGAHALHDEMRRLSPSSVAVVAWYGYHAPRTMSRDVATTARAEEGGRRLIALLGGLRTANAHAPVTFLCHSYGSVVCGSALSGMDTRTSAGLAGVAVFGSPGTGLRSTADLPVRVPLWAGRGTQDWIARAPHVSLSAFGTTLGFGTDPTSPSFGARPFAAGNSGHSGYLEPGSLPLRNLALICLGRGSAVSGG